MTCDTPTPTLKFAAPRGSDTCLMEAGLSWDAVRVPAWLSRAVLPLMNESGAIIEDGRGVWYWLVATGTANGWDLGPRVQVLGAATWIAVPPASRTYRPGVRWVIAPGGGQEALTNSATLLRALKRALKAGVEAG